MTMMMINRFDEKASAKGTGMFQGLLRDRYLSVMHSDDAFLKGRLYQTYWTKKIECCCSCRLRGCLQRHCR